MTRPELHTALDQLVYECHQNSVLHGFYDGPPFNFGEKIALIHSELSEALESARKDPNKRDEHCPDFSNVEIELADAIIRIYDLAGYFCGEGDPEVPFNLPGAILAKMEYNKTRPYKHGKTF